MQKYVITFVLASFCRPVAKRPCRDVANRQSSESSKVVAKRPGGELAKWRSVLLTPEVSFNSAVRQEQFYVVSYFGF